MDNFTEATLRDYLAAQLNIIETGLTLLKKEHYLRNVSGANGYIDILAKDRFNNYVVIEIKRSQQSSRQAIQELLKYIALLKQNYQARDSEIRCIIISTHWDELLIPFSELHYQTTLDVKGLKLKVDESFNPLSCEVVTPLTNEILQRQFSRNYWFDLFQTSEKRDVGINIIAKQSKELGLKDFVIVSLDTKVNSEQPLWYPYATCFAFQSQSICTYLSWLGDEGNIDLKAEEFETEAKYIEYLEDNLMYAILKGSYRDSGEPGSPEKFDAELTLNNWKVSTINRFGIFASDPRYDDNLLVSELKGLDGNNENKFTNVCESTQKDRFIEIMQKCRITIINNNNWQKHIDQIFEHLQAYNSPFRLIIHIYSPQSVFDGLIRTLLGSSFDYLPMYVILADFTEKGELLIFNGKLAWNGKKPLETAVVDFFNDEKNTFISKFTDCTFGYNDPKVMKLFQLHYSHTLSKSDNGKPGDNQAISFKDGTMIMREGKALTIPQWIS